MLNYLRRLLCISDAPLFHQRLSVLTTRRWPLQCEATRQHRRNRSVLRHQLLSQPANVAGTLTSTSFPSCRLVATFSVLDQEGGELSQDKILPDPLQRRFNIIHSPAPTDWQHPKILCYNGLQLVMIGCVICSYLGSPRRPWQCDLEYGEVSGINRRQCRFCTLLLSRLWCATDRARCGCRSTPFISSVGATLHTRSLAPRDGGQPSDHTRVTLLLNEAAGKPMGKDILNINFSLPAPDRSARYPVHLDLQQCPQAQLLTL